METAASAYVHGCVQSTPPHNSLWDVDSSVMLLFSQFVMVLHFHPLEANMVPVMWELPTAMVFSSFRKHLSFTFFVVV